MVAVGRKELFGRWVLGTWVAKVCKVPYIRRSLCAGRQQALRKQKKRGTVARATTRIID